MSAEFGEALAAHRRAGRKVEFLSIVWTALESIIGIIAGVLAGSVRPLNCADGVHLHSRHVHIHVELDVADIDKLTVAITKFDQLLVVAVAKRSFARNEICREVVDILGQEWRV